MRILVPVKGVVDYNVNVRVESDGIGDDFGQQRTTLGCFDGPMRGLGTQARSKHSPVGLGYPQSHQFVYRFI